MLTHTTRCVALLAILLSTLLFGCQTTPFPSQAIPPLHVVSYNIKHGLGMDGKVDLERTRDVLSALDADLIALQEVDERARRSGGIDQAAWFGDELGMQSAFGAFMDFQGGRYGLALLSRHQIVSHEVWRLPDGNEPRVALAARIRPEQGPEFTAVVVHFDWVKDDSYRFAQASETIDRILTLDTPWIVLGDFNDTPGSRTMDAFHAIADEATKPEGATKTFPSIEPRMEIDFILAGPTSRWHIGAATVIDETAASDHRPVVAELTPTP